MKHRLILYEDEHVYDGPVMANGTIRSYRVGMPPGEEAKIVNYGAPNRNNWQILRIKGTNKGKWTGHYESAEAALAVLQKEFDV